MILCTFWESKAKQDKTKNPFLRGHKSTFLDLGKKSNNFYLSAVSNRMLSQTLPHFPTGISPSRFASTVGEPVINREAARKVRKAPQKPAGRAHGNQLGAVRLVTLLLRLSGAVTPTELSAQLVLSLLKANTDAYAFKYRHDPP